MLRLHKRYFIDDLEELQKYGVGYFQNFSVVGHDIECSYSRLILLLELFLQLKAEPNVLERTLIRVRVFYPSEDVPGILDLLSYRTQFFLKFPLHSHKILSDFSADLQLLHPQLCPDLLEGLCNLLFG